MLKKYVNITIITSIIIAITSLMVFVPIQTNKADCGSGDRFSLILGQYEEFREAETNPDEIFTHLCPTWLQEDIPNYLYIL